MRRRSKLLLGALVATTALGALVTTTSAHRLALSNQTFRAVWSSLEFVTSVVTVRCPVTMEGSFHSRTLSKVLEQLIGYVTRAAVGTCVGGTVTLQALTLPWHIRYNGFSGTLPDITEIHIRLIGAGYLLSASTPFGLLACLYEATAANPMRLWLTRAVTGFFTQIFPDASAQVKLFTRLASSVVPCPAEHNFKENEGEITVLGATTPITLTLVA